MSTEICSARVPSAAIPSMTGTTRSSSSSAGTGSAPGRVDSPPTSTIAAPSAISRRAWRTACAGVLERPAVRERVGRDVDDAHDRVRDHRATLTNASRRSGSRTHTVRISATKTPASPIGRDAKRWDDPCVNTDAARRDRHDHHRDPHPPGRPGRRARRRRRVGRGRHPGVPRRSPARDRRLPRRLRGRRGDRDRLLPRASSPARRSASRPRRRTPPRAALRRAPRRSSRRAPSGERPPPSAGAAFRGPSQARRPTAAR